MLLLNITFTQKPYSLQICKYCTYWNVAVYTSLFTKTRRIGPPTTLPCKALPLYREQPEVIFSLLSISTKSFSYAQVTSGKSGPGNPAPGKKFTWWVPDIEGWPEHRWLRRTGCWSRSLARPLCRSAGSWTRADRKDHTETSFYVSGSY